MNQGSSIVGTIIYLIILVAIIAGLWKIYTKAGKPGWAVLIPIYNLIVLLQIVGKPIWWIVLFIIPIANIVAFILVYIELIKKFGQPTWHVIALILLPFVYIPYLGFGDVKYQA